MDRVGLARFVALVPRAFVPTKLTIGIKGDREGCLGSQAEHTDPEQFTKEILQARALFLCLLPAGAEGH